MEEFINGQLEYSISYYNEEEKIRSAKATTKGLEEPNPSVCFYHGYLVGIFGAMNGYRILSNREQGT